MQKIRVNLKKTEDRSYDILIGKGILERIPEDLKKQNMAHSYAIITDSNVVSLYGETLYDEFKRAGLNTHLITFPAGEENKNRETKITLEDAMLDLKMGRDSAVIALGGGVVGDIAGYVASNFTRGLPYIQAPTTLVACVDSSIGGKTGVDTPHGKNLIGAFYQPRCVYIDIDTLKTLPEREVREGLAEIIKYGVISDENLFDFLEENIDSVFSFDDEVLAHIIKRSCEIKADVVERDERESNLRKILNFGHTIGHAVEQLSEYSISHGKAISIGMASEGKIAIKMGLWNQEELDRLLRLIQKAGLPTSIPSSFDKERIIDAMKLDKKARRGGIEMALPERIGKMARVDGEYGIKIEEEIIIGIF